MNDQPSNVPEPQGLTDDQATLVAQAREAFDRDLERQHIRAELTEELTRASLEMQTEGLRREHLMNAMLEEHPSSGDTERPR